jgi:hypothetical protein
MEVADLAQALLAAKINGVPRALHPQLGGEQAAAHQEDPEAEDRCCSKQIPCPPQDLAAPGMAFVLEHNGNFSDQLSHSIEGQSDHNACNQ